MKMELNPLLMFLTCEESENEDHDEDMVVDATKQGDEVARALVAADALGKASLSTTSVPFQDIADSLLELDMEHYDEEYDGVELIGTGIGDAYYPSNDMDPYLKDQNDDDSEEVEDMTITAEDAVIVCARNEDDVSHLEVWIYEDPADGDSNMYVHHDIIISAFPLCTAWLDCPIKGGEKAPFLAVGLLEALGAAAGMAAGAILSGAAIPIFSQSLLVWQLLLSYIFLGRRYRFNQLLGCFLVAIGVIITVARANMMSGGEVFR